MSIFFSRLQVGYPEPLKELVDFPNSWKVYTILLSNDKRTCTTRSDIFNLQKADKKKARLAFVALINRAQTGQPFSELYDKKRCHEAFSFKYEGADFPIWRIRTADVRIYFCYLPNKNIVLLKTLAKREDELSDGEKQELKDIALKVLRHAEPETFIARVI